MLTHMCACRGGACQGTAAGQGPGASLRRSTENQALALEAAQPCADRPKSEAPAQGQTQGCAAQDCSHAHELVCVQRGPMQGHWSRPGTGSRRGLPRVPRAARRPPVRQTRTGPKMPVPCAGQPTGMMRSGMTCGSPATPAAAGSMGTARGPLRCVWDWCASALGVCGCGVEPGREGKAGLRSRTSCGSPATPTGAGPLRTVRGRPRWGLGFDPEHGIRCDSGGLKV